MQIHVHSWFPSWGQWWPSGQ